MTFGRTSKRKGVWIGYSTITAICFATSVQAEIRWNTIGGHWSDHTNWTPAVVPGGTDDALIGISNTTQGEVVTLDKKATVNNLTVENGAILENGSRKLNVHNDTRLHGSPDFTTTLRVSPATGFGNDFTSDDLAVHENALFELLDGATMRVDRQLVIQKDGLLRGTGEVRVANPTGNLYAFNNSGTFRSTGELTIRAGGNDRISLDGSYGTGQLVAEAPNTLLTIHGGSHLGQFDGQLHVRESSRIQTFFDSPWAVGTQGLVKFSPTPHLDTVSYWQSNDVTFYGTVGVEDLTHAIISSDSFALADSAQINVGAGAELDLVGPVSVRGGQFTSDLMTPGSIDFNGPTHWGGSITNSAQVIQLGPATVSQQTVIHGGIFDLDGNEDTPWEINAGFTLNVDQIDVSSIKPNRFNGVMTIGAGRSNQASAVINLPEGTLWTMMGEMNLHGNDSFPERLAGSPIVLGGELSVSEQVNVAADMTFASGSNTSLPAGDVQLELTGNSTLHAKAGFAGHGTLRNVGNMRLKNGASTGEVSVRNNARIDVEVGTANVASFTNGKKGIVAFQLDADEQQTMFSQLAVLGDAHLIGILELSMVDEVALYETMPIITATDAVIGQFDQVLGETPDPSLGLAVTYEPLAVNVTPALLGDVDLNGDVNFADFLVVSGNFGNSGTWVDGDIDGDGTVAFSDFLGLSGNFGSSAAVSAVAVPEPNSAVLAIFLGGMFTWSRRRR